MPDYERKFIGRDAAGEPLQIGVSGGRIVASGPELGDAGSETDFGDAMILPGWIDAHVHFNEPGRGDWEGISSGSRALAAGGGTVFFDMPLNSSPPVISARALEEKRSIAERKSWTDFALWGGLTPASVPHLREMAEAGAIGFKAFLCPSGLDEYPAADRRTLLDGARIAADLGLPVAVHAELGDPFRPDPERTDFRAWCESRPVTMELAGIELALEAAEATGAAFHIVHVSSPEGVDRIREAKGAGIDVSIETCPHYLLLDDQIGAEIGALAKCAPPLRSPERLAELWDRLERGEIDTIGSDHSPCPPDLKQGDDIFAIWGGIAGIQHGLPLLLGRSPKVTTLISEPVAARFRLAHKGGLVPGVDADFSVIEPGTFAVGSDPVLTRHDHSPYRGLDSAYRVRATYLRGEPIIGPGRARFLRPQQT